MRAADRKVHPRKTRARGFSLLEVILALMTLAVAVTYLTALGRLALKNAARTRDLAKAQMMCESKIAEIVSGITSTSPVDKQAFESSTEAAVANDPNSKWVYSIEQPAPPGGGPGLEQGLIAIRVSVTKDLPEGQNPINFSLDRWIPDPNYVPPQTSSSSGTSGSSSGTSTGGSNGS
jgi:type II secretory pathway pseudopilin PulG